MSFVALGGYKFAVKGKIREFFVQRQTTPFRLQGVQSRRDDASVNRFFFDSFPLGIGFQEMHRENGYGVGGLLDSTAETRFNGIFPGGLAETQTHAAPTDHFKKAVNFKGDFWGAFEQDYEAAALQCTCVTKFGASTDTWVAVDAPMYNDSSTGLVNAVQNTITVSHTVQSTFANRIVVAFVYSTRAAGAQTPTGVTYAGSAMTQVSTVNSGAEGVSLWRIVAPTTGTNDCVATFSGNFDVARVHVADYYFVNQTTPFGTAQTGTGTATSTTVPAITTTAGDLVVGGVHHNAAEATAVGSGLYEREDDSATLSAEYSEGRATGTSTTWAASWATNSLYVAVAAPLLAAGFVSAPITTVAEGARVFDMAVHKASMWLLINGPSDPTVTIDERIYKVYSSTDGDAWVDAAGTGWPDNVAINRYLPTAVTRRNNFDDDMGKLLSYGNVLLAAIRRHPDSVDGATLADVEVLSSTDSGTNWDSDATIPSADGPKAFVDWLALDGTRSPVLILCDGIYSINTTADTFEKIYELDGDPANGRWAAVDNMGALRVGLGSGQILVLNISDTGHLTTYISNPPGGLVTARQGHVNYMLSTPSEWFFVAYGGHAASKTASVFAIDSSVILTDPLSGKWYNPWTHIWVDTTGNLDIVALAYSTEDDATPRLHFAVEGTAAAINYHIEEPLTNPATTTTKKFLASSYFDLPEDGLGDPHSATMMLFAQVRAKSLSASTAGEYISHQYGIDGAASTTVTLGNYLSGDLDLSFFSTGPIASFADGSNGLVTVTDTAHGLLEGDSVTISATTNYNGTYTIQDVATNTFAIRATWVATETGTWHCYKGVSAKTISHRFTLIRDAATTTDRVHVQEIEYQGQNVYLDKKAWQFTIDVEASPVTVVGGTNKAETIKANIQAMASGGVLLPFEFSESSGVIYVRIPNDSPPVFDLDIVDSDEQRRGFTSGDVLITVEEGA